MDNIGRPCVVLADGTQLLADVGRAGADAIWIWIRDAEDPYNNLVRLSQLLSNPDATVEITRWYGSQVTTFTGYTRLTKVYMYDGLRAGARLERMVGTDV